MVARDATAVVSAKMLTGWSRSCKQSQGGWGREGGTDKKTGLNYVHINM